VPDRGKLLLNIDFAGGGKIAAGANFPPGASARQQLPLWVKFAGMR